VDIGGLKASVAGEIGACYQPLAELSRKIHDTPEVAFQEFKAATWLAGYLEANGFSVEKDACGLPTAFRGTYGRGKPVIALLAEYDALPKLGHACGHNLIATCTVGAGVACRQVVDGLGGSVVVIGTPGEEGYGGKVIMAERGAFDGLDMAMIVHPGGGNAVAMKTLACQTLEVEFFGKAAHAAAKPEAGINALEAMIQSYNAINSLRQHVRGDARIHGVITDGGEAANIVPAHTAASFIVRAGDDSYLDELEEKVIKCFAGAATASGAKLEYQWGERYAAMLNNMTLARLFRRNMQLLGHKMRLSDTRFWSGSSDVGNVSRLVPAIQPFVGIAPEDVLVHSPDFAAAAGSEAGLARMLDAARALAMTVADLLASPETVEAAQEEFRRGG
jgi:amidohydrolase